jgi:hypothetical protein
MALSLLRRRLAVYFAYLPHFSLAFVLLLCTQFHLPFYLSRLLPNSFALLLCTFAFALSLPVSVAASSLGVVPANHPSSVHPADLPPTHSDVAWCVWLLTAACSIFRCDVILLAFPYLFMLLWTRRISFWRLVAHGVLSSIVCVAATVLIDSYFWQRWLWPEGEVAWFNAPVAGHDQSARWGISPVHWYFTSAIPRALFPGSLLIFLPVGLFVQVRASFQSATLVSGQSTPMTPVASVHRACLDGRTMSLVRCQVIRNCVCVEPTPPHAHSHAHMHTHTHTHTHTLSLSLSHTQTLIHTRTRIRTQLQAHTSTQTQIDRLTDRYDTED